MAFGIFIFLQALRKSINGLTEVETTSFDQRNEYREIELALKASRKREIAWWAWPTWSRKSINGLTEVETTSFDQQN
ncbi:hypothetical protein SM122_06025 [Streptococcus sp. S2(2023)]|uniref:Uncharacterized protein n=1 Tax=Streptococcus gingivalis TaxID=3111861 RepID=A0ABU6B8W7_9STRE|nr:hypothetical protein [Streptococcus sp. S2(2023)]MEB3520146.1 hypothetical protein [Streptococcus sp. S2(2023)]